MLSSEIIASVLFANAVTVFAIWGFWLAKRKETELKGAFVIVTACAIAASNLYLSHVERQESRQTGFVQAASE